MSLLLNFKQMYMLIEKKDKKLFILRIYFFNLVHKVSGRMLTIPMQTRFAHQPITHFAEFAKVRVLD